MEQSVFHEELAINSFGCSYELFGFTGVICRGISYEIHHILFSVKTYQLVAICHSLQSKPFARISK